MSTSHILSAVDPHVQSNGTNGSHSPHHALHQGNNGENLMASNGAVSHHGNLIARSSGNGSSPNPMERNLHVSLDDRELWLRFQNLTNEMIVTKNGR